MQFLIVTLKSNFCFEKIDFSLLFLFLMMTYARRYVRVFGTSSGNGIEREQIRSNLSFVVIVCSLCVYKEILNVLYSALLNL